MHRLLRYFRFDRRKIRRVMIHSMRMYPNSCFPFGCIFRRRLTLWCLSLIFLFLFIIVSCFYYPRVAREDELDVKMAEIQMHMQYLKSQCRIRQEELLSIVNNLLPKNHSKPYLLQPLLEEQYDADRLGPDNKALAHGSQRLSSVPFVRHLMPHLMDNPKSLTPAYLLSKNRHNVDVVIGVPTVRRDKASYLMDTLNSLVINLEEKEAKDTLIIVFIGETDIDYVKEVASEIKAKFPTETRSGLIDILSPSPSYYPDFEALEPTLGDSMKRTKWRTKQNLDCIYLMAYAQSKGLYYLMLEDDVIAEPLYMTAIKDFLSQENVKNKKWVFIEFCMTGGIGKLMKNYKLMHFITYVQLFYVNMPIDWLLESFLTDLVCTIEKTGKACDEARLGIRPRYKTCLFRHIGLYSSLKGKIQTIQTKRTAAAKFFPHDNPPVQIINCDIQVNGDHSIYKAYNGEDFFWGHKPRAGDKVEFVFRKPLYLKSYLFRSASATNLNDKFYNTVVEILPAKANNSYIQVNTFDEFGLAEGELRKDQGPIKSIRLRVVLNSRYWVILSEILLVPYDDFIPI